MSVRIIVVIVLLVSFSANTAFCGKRKDCIRSVGGMVYNGGRSAVGFGGAAYDIRRGGAGNVGVANGVKYWGNAKNSARDVRANCFPRKK